MHLRTFARICARDVLTDVTEGADGHGHENLVEIGALVDPTSISTVRVVLVVGDEIRFEILLPEADALHFEIGITVNVNRSTVIVD